MNLEKIAGKLRISRRTVSRVLKNDKYVDEGKRKRVLKYLKKNRYVPNFNASSLAVRNSKVVSMVLPRGVIMSIDYFLAETIKCLSLELEKNGHYLMIFTDEKHEYEKLFGLYESKTVGGFVIFSPSNNDVGYMNEIRKSKIPAVIVFSHFKGIDSFSCDNFNGAYAATKHLIDSGKRNIGFIHGHLSWVDSQDRFFGYLSALKDAGVKYRPELVKIGYFDYEGGRKAAEEMLSEGKADAIFAANDKMAIGAIYAINGAGKSVPEDIAVVGFDDILEGKFISPSLTTVSQPIGVIIENAARRLSERMKSKKFLDPIFKTYEPDLIKRKSA
ncbi:MAG: LacI family DNA-binding transcriptional regulator [Elusimicrobiota bacterium]